MLIPKKQYSRSDASLYLLGLRDKNLPVIAEKPAIISNPITREFQPRDTITHLHLCPDASFPF